MLSSEVFKNGDLVVLYLPHSSFAPVGLKQRELRARVVSVQLLGLFLTELLDEDWYCSTPWSAPEPVRVWADHACVLRRLPSA